MAKINSNKETPSHSQRSLLLKYLITLGKSVYRPVKPIRQLADPLLKKIKIVYLLVVLLIVGMIGNYQYWQEKRAFQASQKQKTVIQQEIVSLEKELEKKPEYRDVLLKLALLNYQILETEKAKEYWNRANYLDPNNLEVQKIGEVISSQL
ncbi:MAG: hypothetical protein NTZ93_04100 [Candidatus Beckwithbacteria bacterium]|nr:hypothetical protein [Candidatus Beckwithbacteria bacterium]